MVYFMTSEQAGTQNQCISVLLDLHFQRELEFTHSSNIYSASTLEQIQNIQRLAGEKKKKTKPHGTYKFRGEQRINKYTNR